jgi:hypothetical protein
MLAIYYKLSYNLSSVMLPKTANELQAQLAAYSSENITSQTARDYLFANIGSISARGLDELTHISYPPNTDSSSKLTQDTFEGTIISPATANDYLEYIGRVHGSSHEPIRQRTSMLDAYERFKPAVAAVVADPNNLDSLLDTGNNARIHKITVGGNDYAVRFPLDKIIGWRRRTRVAAEHIDSHIGGLILAKGLPHFEQWAAASYNDGLTISEILPGKKFNQLSLDDIDLLETEHLQDFVHSLHLAHSLRIIVDHNSSNILFDPSHGISILDFQSYNAAIGNWPSTNIAQYIGAGASVLSKIGLVKELDLTTLEGYENNLALSQRNLPVLKLYRSQVEKHTGIEDKNAALWAVDYQIERNQTRITEYSNRQWVADALARNQRYSASQQTQK